MRFTIMYWYSRRTGGVLVKLSLVPETPNLSSRNPPVLRSWVPLLSMNAKHQILFTRQGLYHTASTTGAAGGLVTPPASRRTFSTFELPGHRY